MTYTYETYEDFLEGQNAQWHTDYWTCAPYRAHNVVRLAAA